MEEEESAECRGCRAKLRGKPYYRGGLAYSLVTGKEAKKNHYGGFVCSRSCDVRSSLELEGTMPGCGSIRSFEHLSLYAKESIRNNWPDA